MIASLFFMQLVFTVRQDPDHQHQNTISRINPSLTKETKKDAFLNENVLFKIFDHVSVAFKTSETA